MNAITIEALHHARLRQRIIEMEPDIDEATLADTLEGMTNLHEMLAEVARAALDDEVMSEALRSRVATMDERRQRLQERAERRRALVRELMVETDIKKIAAEDLTLSLRQGGRSVVVTDILAIPEPFWEHRAPRLNRSALQIALRQGEMVEGACLSNAEPVLSVRTK